LNWPSPLNNKENE